MSAGFASLAGADEIRANRSETRSQGHITTRSYIGDVQAAFQQSRITSDSAVVTSESNQYRFYRDIRFQDGRHTVFADTVTYNVSDRTAVLSGRVRLSDKERHLSAERVTYRVGPQTVEASGNVQIRFPGDAGTVRADYWFRDVAADSSFGRGNVRFTRYKLDTLFIQANSLSVRQLGSRMRFSRDVRIHQGKWKVQSRIATFLEEDERVILEEDVHLFWETSNGNSASASADRAELILENNTIREMYLYSDAEIEILRDRAKGTLATIVSSDTCRVTFENQEVTEMQASGHVTIQFDTPGSASSHLTGAVAHLLFKEGLPRRIQVDGPGELQYESSDQSLRARITGHGLTVDLTDSDLRGVSVDSEAVCHLQGEHPLHLSGDRLSLTFEQGSLVKAEVEGGVQGQYRSEGITK